MGRRYRVVLEARLRGAAVGSTDDVIDAADPDGAVIEAVRRWRRVDRSRTYVPLVVRELRDGDAAGQGPPG